MEWHRRFLQQAAWTHDLRAYLFECAGLNRSHRVLEVGCGTGAILSDILTPAAVHGLDLDPANLASACKHAPDAKFVCGNALELPYPSRCFDITFCHFLLLWVADPLMSLHEMKRVTCLGGSVLALAEPDYEKRQDLPAALAPLGHLQTESLRRQGADPGLGSRLAGLFHQAGIKPVETGTLHNNGGRLFTPVDLDLEWVVLKNDLKGQIPAKEIHRMMLLDKQAWERGDRVLNVPTYFAWGIV